MAKYKRINWTERLIIEKHYNNGMSYRQIATALCRAVSTIYAEIQNGLYEHLGAETTKRKWHYSADIAQNKATVSASNKGISIKLGHNYQYAYDVSRRIANGQSPDTIVHEYKKNNQWTVSTTTLYRYIDLGYIPNVTNENLWEKNRRKPRHKHFVKACRPPKGNSIENRPAAIDTRSEFGHWEMDSIIGKSKGVQESLLVLTERMTRFELVFRVMSKESRSTVKALNLALSRFPVGTFKTITVDNGSEFQDCYNMEYKDGVKRLSVYYCHPYSSYERGSNERANRILRRFFPKGQSLSQVTQHDCDIASEYLNQLSRKILDYKTPAELFIAQIHNIEPSFVVPLHKF